MFLKPYSLYPITNLSELIIFKKKTNSEKLTWKNVFFEKLKIDMTWGQV